MSDDSHELVGPPEVGPKQAVEIPAQPSTEPAPPPRRPARGRRRRQPGGRPHAVLVRLSDEEYAVLWTAAASRRLTPTSFVATQALAVARGLVHPLPSSVVEVLRQLVEARAQLNRYGVLLNQAVARLHVTGVPDPGLARALQRCEGAAAEVRAATVRLGR